jgi:hypothetical protein
MSKTNYFHITSSYSNIKNLTVVSNIIQDKFQPSEIPLRKITSLWVNYSLRNIEGGLHHHKHNCPSNQSGKYEKTLPSFFSDNQDKWYHSSKPLYLAFFLPIALPHPFRSYIIQGLLNNIQHPSSSYRCSETKNSPPFRHEMVYEWKDILYGVPTYNSYALNTTLYPFKNVTCISVTFQARTQEANHCWC